MATSSLPDRAACYRHADQLTGTHCTRCARPICADCMTPAPDGPYCPTCAHETAPSAGGLEGGPGAVRGGRPWAPDGPRRVTPVVGALIAVNVAVFVLTSIHRPWEIDYAQIPIHVAHGQSYRLLTAAFIHENFTHLLFNMASLVIMGPPVEEALGRNRFLVLYLLAALGGSVCSFLLLPSSVAGVGASGAIFGIFGAWFSLARAARSDTAVILLLITVLLAYSFYDKSIDWRAHVGGLVTGAMVGSAYAAAARRPVQVRVALEVSVVVGILATFGVLVVMRSARL